MENQQHGIFEDLYTKVSNHLVKTGQIKQLSATFGKLKTNEERVAFILNLPDIRNILTLPLSFKAKSSEDSIKLKNEGNKLFQKGAYSEALVWYNKSVLFAPCDQDKDNIDSKSELSLALANRSATLYHLKYFRLCMTDIDQAMNNGYPVNLQYKLYDRQGKCHLALGDASQAKESFAKAQKALSLANLDSKRKEAWAKDIKNQILLCAETGNARESIIIKDKGRTPEAPKLPDKTNDCYVSLAGVCDVKYTPEQGRYIVANRDIDPGEVLLVEKPFASVLLPQHHTSHCHQCLAPLLVLVPCRQCAAVAYCGKTCCQASWDTYHQVECQILNVIRESGIGKFGFLALRTITVKPNKFFETFKRNLSTSKGKISAGRGGFGPTGKFCWDDYGAIYDLVTHADDRPVHDLFRRATMAVFLVTLLQTAGYFKKVDTLHECSQKLQDADLKDAGDGEGEQLRKGRPSSLESLPENAQESSDDTLKYLAFLGGLLLSHLQLLPCNAHEISELQLNKNAIAESVAEEIGAGIYATLSLFNHSCDPVVNRNFYGDTCVVRSIRTIKAGEEVADNYGAVYAVHARPERQQKLKSQYYFTCCCMACTDNWPLYPDIECQTPLWKCDSCSHPLGATDISGRLILCGRCDTKNDLTVKEAELSSSRCDYMKAFDSLLMGDVEVALPAFQKHLEVMGKHVCQPWQDYNNCQEALKQCFSILANSHDVTEN